MMKLNIKKKNRWTIPIAFILAIVMVGSAAILFAPHLGWRIDNVLSGSMSPAITVGSAVVTQPVDVRTIDVGDVITYRSPRNGEVTTHRVVEIKSEIPRTFITKGDANEDVDPYTVPATNVEGKIVFDVPLLGYVADFIKTPMGFILVLGVPGGLIILLELRKMWIDLSEEDKRKKGMISVIEEDK